MCISSKSFLTKNKHETAFPAKTARNNQNAYNIDSNYLLYYSYLVLIQITIQNIFKSSFSSLSHLQRFLLAFLPFSAFRICFWVLLTQPHSNPSTLKFTTGLYSNLSTFLIQSYDTTFIAIISDFSNSMTKVWQTARTRRTTFTLLGPRCFATRGQK